jgi:hypothetical protein
VLEVGLQLPVTGLVAVIVRLAGQLGLSPVEGETDVVSVIIPVKPPVEVAVMVDVPVEVDLKSAGDVADRVKSEGTGGILICLPQLFWHP